MTDPWPKNQSRSEVRFGQRLSRRGHWLRSALSSGPAVLWLGLLLVVPLGMVSGMSFLSRGEYGGVELPLTLDSYKRLLGFGELGFDPLYPVILLRSVTLGAVTAAICVLAALPLAFFIARLPGSFKGVALTLVVIPFWTNLLIRTYAWQILLAPESWITRMVQASGIGVAGEPLYPGLLAVLIGMVCDYLPFLVLPVYASVEKIDWSLAEAAADLGANRAQVFRHALLPQIMPGLVAGVILVFLPATGQFVISDLLGGAKTAMLGNVIQQQFGSSRDWPFGGAISFVALLLVMAGVWLYLRRGDKEDSVL
jgi:spermidine/putrescine transport system permease protein